MLKLIVAFAAVAASNFAAANRVVCYYDSRSIHREGPGRMIPSDIDPVLSYCTHLIYGYAKIDSHQKIAALDESLDLSSGKDNYRAITALKKRFPQVKFLLSVGGGADLDDADKYNKILEDSSNRAQFVHSVKAFLKRNDFDGLDLSWQLPEIYKKKDRGTFGSIWHGVKKTFGYAHSHKDEKADEHREGFTKLVQDLRKELRDDNLLLTATVLSNVNASLYFEADKLAKEIDQIHLKAFDFKSPQKDPNEADYSAALFPSEQRDPFFTVDGQVRSFIERGFPSNKIILGIPTYAVTWKLTSESKISGVPPIQAEGPGEEGPQTKSPGRLSYAEVCSLIDNPINKGNNKHLLRRVNDPAKKSGSYGFRLPDGDSVEGVWASFTDPDTAGDKAAYAKAKSLGGIAFWDISLDDFRGVCNGVKYPIIHTAKNRVTENLFASVNELQIRLFCIANKIVTRHYLYYHYKQEFNKTCPFTSRSKTGGHLSICSMDQGIFTKMNENEVIHPEAEIHYLLQAY